MTICVGNGGTLGPVRRWFKEGILGPKSAAASPLMDDFNRLHMSMGAALTLPPFSSPMERATREICWTFRDVFKLIEEFRIFAVPKVVGAVGAGAS